MIDLIYCGSGNRYLEKIARDCGFKYGLRLPQTKLQNYNLYFSDQDYKRPNKNKYIEFVKMYTPFMATVIDIEKYEQFSEAVEWANEISDFVNTIIFIPKCKNVIEKLPRFIKNKKIILGFSVPSRYGRTDLDTSEFNGWDIHLLGGSPHRQLEYASMMNVISMDCNYHGMKANRFGEYWTGEKGCIWKYLKGDFNPRERSYKAFELSCINIYKKWENI